MVITPEKTPGDTKWFLHERFGMFIHWGLYALPARHEWVKSREHISTERYEKYFEHFEPDLYDPEQWASLAEEAGMKYFVITTKHHEGFCLWDTAYTDYKATNTLAGRDLLRPALDAFRNKGLKAGLYYSLLDWHHPQYTVDVHHPMSLNESYIAADRERDLAKYTEYLHNQTRELLTDYGKIDIMWFDFSIQDTDKFKGKGKDEWQSEKLIKMIRDLQPGIILNDRLQIEQDLKTPEQIQPREWVKVNGKPVIWEACQTLSGSWGYHRDEDSFKSVEMLVKMLIDTVSKGGNLLLNVGPTGRGDIDYRAINSLKGIGKWMKYHNRSIYGCTQAPDEFKCPADCRYTYNPDTNRLYLHVFSWPFKHLHLENMADKVKYAQLLNDASEINMSKKDSILTLSLPIKKPNVEVPVIELFV